MTANAKFTKCSFQGRKMYYVDGDEVRTGTVVAAHNTNRNFIGCELSKEYFDKTLERFDELGFKYTEVVL